MVTLQDFPGSQEWSSFFVSLFWASLKSQQQSVQLVWDPLTHKPKNALLPSTDAAEKGKIIARAHHVKLPQGCVSELVAHLWLQRRHPWKGFWSLGLCGGWSSPWHEEWRAKAIPASQAHHNGGLDLTLYLWDSKISSYEDTPPVAQRLCLNAKY